MLTAADFIDEVRLLIDIPSEKHIIKDISDPEMFVYLQGAYTMLQSFVPQFYGSVKIPTITDQNVYHVDDEIQDAIKLTLNGEEFTKTSITQLQDLTDETKGYYATNINEIFLNISPKDDTGMISFFYNKIKILHNMDAAIQIPYVYHEALRLLTLSRAFEKMFVSKDNKSTDNKYYQKAMSVLSTVKNRNKPRYKMVQSNHQKV